MGVIIVIIALGAAAALAYMVSRSDSVQIAGNVGRASSAVADTNIFQVLTRSQGFLYWFPLVPCSGADSYGNLGFTAARRRELFAKIQTLWIALGATDVATMNMTLKWRDYYSDEYIALIYNYTVLTLRPGDPVERLPYHITNYGMISFAHGSGPEFWIKLTQWGGKLLTWVVNVIAGIFGVEDLWGSVTSAGETIAYAAADTVKRGKDITQPYTEPEKVSIMALEAFQRPIVRGLYQQLLTENEIT